MIMKRIAWTFVLVMMTAFPLSAAAANDFSVSAAVESSHVFVGESFVFQITVEGEDSPDQPRLPDMTDFSARFAGGQQNNSSSITIINGKMTQNVRRGYVFSWQMTPRRAGNLEIPSVAVTAGSRSARTQPVRIQAAKPREMDDFKLALALSTDTCYVGQPVTLSAIWYIGADVQQFQFNLPVLDDPRFEVADWNMPVDPNNKDRYLQVPLGNRQAIGIKEQRTINSKPYMAVRIDKVLIPKTAGKITLDEATVSFTAVTGYRQPSGRMMDNFFGNDVFGNFRQPVTKKFVIPSNTLDLNVRPLPDAGRPDNFNGLVGNYFISAQASPTQVKVGDPITLTLKVTGPDYLDPVKLPPLDQQTDLSADFRIPAEMAPGVVENGAKVFTQTIRAARADVTAIPAISLPYFDADAGEYRVAATAPIPLEVSATRVVTAMDAEGNAAAETQKNELETRAEGIAYNYEDLSVLQDQAAGPGHWVRSPLWIGLLAGFPALYFILFAFTAFRRSRLADPEGNRRKKAYARLLKQLNAIDNPGAKTDADAAAAVLSALREYLAAKLRLPTGARTWREMESALKQHGIEEAIVAEAKSLFDACEAMGYGGIRNTDAETAPLTQRASALAGKLERSLS